MSKRNQTIQEAALKKARDNYTSKKDRAAFYLHLIRKQRFLQTVEDRKFFDRFENQSERTRNVISESMSLSGKSIRVAMRTGDAALLCEILGRKFADTNLGYDVFVLSEGLSESIVRMFNERSNVASRILYCGNCGNRTPQNKCRIIGSNSYCESCTSLITECGRCGEPTLATRRVLNSLCAAIGNWCPNCTSRLFIWSADGELHDTREPSSGVGGYHSSRNFIREIGSPISGLPPVGFELEWGPADRSMTTRDKLTKELRKLENIVAGVEQDGSVSGISGAEIVTHYGSLDAVQAGADAIALVLSGKAISHNTNCCGLHVSLGRDGINQEQVAKYVVFWNNPKNRAFLKSFARRWESGYCRPKSEKGKILSARSPGFEALIYNHDRYELVNVQNSNRIEIRAFRGTTNAETLKRCISLSAWIMSYLNLGGISLEYKDFLSWCKSAKLTRGSDQFTPDNILQFSKAMEFTS